MSPGTDRIAGPLSAVLALVLALTASPSAGAATPSRAADRTAHAVAGAPPAPALATTADIVIDAGTGQRLTWKAAERELPIASTTKLMTALITLEREPKLATVFTEPDYHPAAVDSQIGLRPGERMSVHDLLEALMLPSADDAAEDLAYNVGHGSVDSFVAMMNARARQLGLEHTHYTTPIGLDTPGNYSTAGDLATLARYLLAHSPFFARVVALPSATLASGDYVRRVVNRNDLVARYSWVDGVKTGHTSSAGYVLVGSGRRGSLRLISVVLGTPSMYERDRSTLALLDYAFASFHTVSPVRRGQTLVRIPVRDQPDRTAMLIATASFSRLLPATTRMTLRVQAPRQIAGPARRGERRGQVLVLGDGRVLARIPLVLARAVPALSGWTKVARFVGRPTTLVLLLVIALGSAFLVVRRVRAAGVREARANPA